MDKISKISLLAFAFLNVQFYLKATTYTVTDYSSFETAMSSAVAGDTIEITVTTAIPVTATLRTSNAGTSGNPITITATTTGIVDGSTMNAGAGPIFGINQSYWVIENLTIQNGNGGNGTSSSVNGTCGGIQISNAGNITISNCSISGCQANGFSGTNPGTGGVGAIQVYNNSDIPTLTGLTINSCQANGGNNTGSGAGANGGTGAISIAGSSSNVISDSTIENNTANGGDSASGDHGIGGTGGIFLNNSSSSNTINNVIITKNQANDGTGVNPTSASGGIGAIEVTNGSNNSLIENNTITYNSATGSSIGSTISINNNSNLVGGGTSPSSSISSNTISNNQVTIGVPGIRFIGNSSRNLISNNTITDNSSDPSSTYAVISVENDSTLDSILTNTIYGNTPPAVPKAIALISSGNNNQQAPTINSAMACPCGAGGAWQLIISGETPAAASGGNDLILVQVYFNSLTDPELNKYIGFFTFAPSSTFTDQKFSISVDDLTIYNRVTSTATNSNYTNPFTGTTSEWGDTSALSAPASFTVS